MGRVRKRSGSAGLIVVVLLLVTFLLRVLGPFVTSGLGLRVFFGRKLVGFMTLAGTAENNKSG